jgi:hypothetical protein
VAVAAMALLPSVAGAKSEPITRTAGDYDLSVRYQREPPLMDVANALVIEVRDRRSGTLVPGLEGSLLVNGQAQVNQVVRPIVVYLRPAAGKPGAYEGVFVPPAVGEYRFQLLGSINGTAIDELFSSGEGGLPEVAVAKDSYTSPGAILALTILGAFLVGLVVIAMRQRSQRRQRQQPAA